MQSALPGASGHFIGLGLIIRTLWALMQLSWPISLAPQCARSLTSKGELQYWIPFSG